MNAQDSSDRGSRREPVSTTGGRATSFLSFAQITAERAVATPETWT
jgi:hypothetical protein